MEKRDNPSSSNKHDIENSRKYKFYRKPSIKKKGPEVKQTKTSLARLFKANPLLKYEYSANHEPPHTKEIKLEPVNPAAPKMSINNISGNGPHVKSKIINFDRHRISSSDFITPKLLSSTLIEPDDVFIECSDEPPLKGRPKITSSKEEKRNNNKPINKKNDERKTISSQYLNKKKRDYAEKNKKGNTCIDLSKVRVKSLRRSLSVDSFRSKGCYTIEEEDNLLGEAKSMQYLIQQEVPDEIKPTSDVLKSIALEDLENRPEKPLVKQTAGPINGEVYDDENKENIEVCILESDSYEDLKISNGK